MSSLEPWLAFLIFLGLVYLAVIIHLSSMMLAGLIYRCAIEEVSFGYGKELFRIPLRRFTLLFRLLPLGGYVKFVTREEQEFAANKSAASQLVLQEDLGFYSKIVIALSGCIVLMVIACLLNGTKVIFSGFYIWQHYFLGAISPLSQAQDFIRQGAEYISSSSVILVFGFICAKFSAFNLLPLGSMNGGYVVSEFIRLILGSRFSDGYLHTTLWLLLICSLIWLFAIGYYVISLFF